MANVQKYTMRAVGHMLNDYARKENDGVERGNKQIDKSRTHLNYKLSPERIGIDKDGNEYIMSDYQVLQKRLSEVKHMNLSKRTDINVLCDWIITLPEDVPPERAKEFFENAYAFCCDRYGENNVVSAHVHMDETTPHMHFAFVPVVVDAKGSEKLCAKELISKLELSKFHPQLQEYMVSHMGQPVGILNGATVGGNLTIIEMKMRKALEELAQVQARTGSLDKADSIIIETMHMMEEVGKLYKKLDTDLKAKKWFGDDDKAKMKALTRELDELKQTVKSASETVRVVRETMQKLDSDISRSVDSVFDTMKKLEADAQRRIKRTENKLKRREERVATAEIDVKIARREIDEEIEKGVKVILSGMEEPIRKKLEEYKALDEEIRQKQQQLSAINMDFWGSQEFLRQAYANQQSFMDVLKTWADNGDGGMQNESEIFESDVPRR